MHVIGEESSERLDVIPAQYRVLVTRRPKYACRACSNGVVQAPAPEPKRLIKGGLPTETMVAHVLVSKYAWHFPLYRQAQMLKQGTFRWPPICDGMMRLSASQLAALVDGLDWSRLHAHDIAPPDLLSVRA
jgi:transposase